jgi:uncharacterized membrane protein
MSRFPWRTLLFLSVALNLLVIGAVAGAWSAGVRLQREVGDAVVTRMPGPRAFLAALPPETRQLRQAAQQARRDAFEAAATEPYDAERVRAAFARLREADQRAIGVFHDNVIEALARLTPEQRREAMDALRRAAPARRQNIAPAATEGAAPAQDGADVTERQKMRETLRERRRERRERREQLEQQQTP